jgi:hypothetical protein
MSVDASTISPSYAPEARTHGGLDIAPTFPELSPADERGYMSRRSVIPRALYQLRRDVISKGWRTTIDALQGL